MRRKLIILLTVALLLPIGIIGSVQGAFSDTAGHWAESEIADMRQRGLVEGFEDGTFRPDRPVTRAEMVAILIRAMDEETEQSPGAEYLDVPGDYWAAPYITAAKRIGIVSGYPDGTFRPGAPVTRAEAAALFVRSYSPLSERTPATFPDVPEDHWAHHEITRMSAAGIVVGDEAGLFRPNRSLSRAELAVMLWRILNQSGEADAYTLELKRWGIYNDGTHPLETTNGLNAALRWAHEQGYSRVKVPEGTYLIAKGQAPNDPEARINMVSNMTLELHERAVVRKEANGFEAYQTLFIGPNVHDAVVLGGTYLGDRNSHDYSRKDNPNSSGTHESGNGIVLEGAVRVRIEGVKTSEFTGDGIAVGGAGLGLGGLYESAFESGAVDERGNPINDPLHIRTKQPLQLDHPIFQTRRYITFWQPSSTIGREFDVYFYNAEGTFLRSERSQSFGSLIPLPSSAASVIPVFEASTLKGAFMSFWSNDVSRDVTILRSESSFNRRQGITIGGVDGIVIRENQLHDIGGTAPGFGIDVEGMGFFPNLNLTIVDNRLFNNRGDIVFADGHNALVDGNRFESRIGFYSWEAFSDVVLANNTFVGNGIGIRGNGEIRNNTIQNGDVVLSGTGIVFEDATITDGTLRVDSVTPFGVEVSRVTMINNNVKGNALQLGTQPTRLTDVTIRGKTQIYTIVGAGSSESVYTNLRVIDYNVHNGTTLPAGTYDGCYFESNTSESNGLVLNVPGKFVFRNCEFIANNKLMGYEHAQADIAVYNSEFTLKGDVGYMAAVTVGKVQKLLWENNTVRAESLTSGSKPLIKLGGFALPERTEIREATFERNSFISNLKVPAVDTINAGKDAPPYYFVDNTLQNTTLLVKSTDVVE